MKSSQLSSFEIIAVSRQLSIAATFLSSSTLEVTPSDLFKLDITNDFTDISFGSNVVKGVELSKAKLGVAGGWVPGGGE
ncbi:hypothetical protein L484_026393 [Morus notabilis]|uniref:Uncharacterized protein n=1 Tax=Morus notabilis TaxID=981085 RepID=W9QXZ1_9ROSA|nr:hypothetical protein L484_026393 [Morus notabilis]